MAPGLCESCHKKPTFGTHKYCGKTCASQANGPRGPAHLQPKASSTGRNRAAPPGIPQKAVQLCDYCGKKPKFSNFDYCTKSCAALANPSQSNQATVQGKKATKPNAPHVPYPPQNAPAPKRPHNVTKAPQGKVPVSQDDTSDEEECDESDGNTGTDLSAYPTDSDEEEPVVAAPVAAPATAKRAGKPGNPTVQSSRSAPGTCAIPHCGKQVHMDKSGVKTNYCSIKHREEAVTLGLEAPCIMCKRYPQSGSDYFCSSSCRNQSMSKT
ncbi:hypothetical protein BKA82DRAFT_998716 [Pisolithus tinctorius]|uniref:Uncharacterized protein n=1 Tax=Pisolithus tinctorius Marx 270 TaxID=870435 RepID=A0A0C3PEE4_PISTI|nr:hypothetical protein BKA82DRAFT_998716 [Pisolithus tinctorius]KIO06591.1 hypothetical protein M404DRAFT_998716 [Pisolithus tinctorius Marx 270]